MRGRVPARRQPVLATHPKLTKLARASVMLYKNQGRTVASPKTERGDITTPLERGNLQSPRGRVALHDCLAFPLLSSSSSSASSKSLDVAAEVEESVNPPSDR